MLNAIVDRISVTKADGLVQGDSITSFFNGNVTISKQQCWVLTSGMSRGNKLD